MSEVHGAYYQFAKNDGAYYLKLFGPRRIEAGFQSGESPLLSNLHVQPIMESGMQKGSLSSCFCDQDVQDPHLKAEKRCVEAFFLFLGIVLNVSPKSRIK